MGRQLWEEIVCKAFAVRSSVSEWSERDRCCQEAPEEADRQASHLCYLLRCQGEKVVGFKSLYVSLETHLYLTRKFHEEIPNQENQQSRA